MHANVPRWLLKRAFRETITRLFRSVSSLKQADDVFCRPSVPNTHSSLGYLSDDKLMPVEDDFELPEGMLTPGVRGKR